MQNIFTPEMGELKDLLPVNIKKARKKAGLTQSELAEKIGTGRVTIARWETEPQNIGIESLEKIAEACGISVFELVNKQL